MTGERLRRAEFPIGSEIPTIDRRRDQVMDARKAPNVVIIGLGYVGLTLSVALARRGVQVYGIEKRSDVEAFAKLVGQNINPTTRSIWHPKAEIGHFADKAYDDEADEASAE